MRREAIVAFAVVMSVLVVATGPVAAGHGAVVVSQHTTAADFNAAQELTNMSVVGSGASANVTLSASGEQVFESFEDGDIGEYGGDTGAFDTTTAFAADGTQSLNNTGGGPSVISSTAGLSDYPDQGEVWNLSMRTDTDAGFSGFIFGTQNETNFPGGYLVQLAWGDDNLKLFRVSGGSFNQIDETGNTNTDLNASETYRVQVNWTTSDEITVTLFNGNDDQVGDQVSATDSTFTDGGIGWRYDQSSSAEYFWDYVRTSGAAVTPGTYISANHTVEQSEQAWVNVTENTNATAHITVEGWDGSSWNQLAQSTGVTTVSNHTLTWSASSTTKVRINVTVFNDTNNGAPAFTLADDSVGANASAPAVNNSSATPTGDLQTATPTLEIDVNDTDFALAQGDSVDVEFHVDGSSVGTDTLTSNGTASVTISSPLSGGDHTWHVVANDSYGHSVTSQTFDISTPGNITFRRETPVHEIIDDREVNGTIFGEDDGDQFVMNFSTNDGNVSLTNVPVDERLVVQVEADGYQDREVVIDDVFSQNTMYLLNTSVSSVTITFDIQDTTGDFSASDTEFIVQRPINRSLFASGGFTTEAIAGDRIGAATEYIIELEQNARYRIIIRNPGEETRVLGAQIARETGTIPIRINTIDIDANTTQGFNASADRTSSGGNEFVEFVYVDEEDRTNSVDLVIYEYQNASNELHNQTHTGTFGTLKVTEQLSGDQVNTTWAVQYDAVRNGTTHSGTIVIGRQTDPLDVTLSDAWKGRVALLSLIVVGFVVGGGVSPEAGGLAIVATAGIWNYVEWMPSEVTAVAIGFGAITAVGFAVGTRGGEPVQ